MILVLGTTISKGALTFFANFTAAKDEKYFRAKKASDPDLPKPKAFQKAKTIYKKQLYDLLIMAIRVVEFSNGGYKIRKIFA